MAEAQRARWAAIKGTSTLPEPVTQEAPKKKRQISAEGMKNIIAATKKRWRLQKAAAKAQSAPPTKVAAKKVAAKRAVNSAPAKAAKKVASIRKTAVKKATAKKTTPTPESGAQAGA